MSHKQWLLSFGLVIIICTSCNKDTIVQNDEQVGKSRISYFPDVITTGARLVITGSAVITRGIGKKRE